jgi:chromosomal replication initiator protein
VTAHERDVVTAFRTHLVQRLGAARFDVWFGPRARIEFGHDRLQIHVPRPFALDWLRSHFKSELEECGRLAAGTPVAIEFAVEDAPPAEEAAAVQQAAAPAINGEVPPAAQSTPSQVNSAQPDAESIARRDAASRPARRPYASLAEFVVGASNRVAFAAAQSAAENPGGLSPVFLHGPTGVGKTHLLEGVFDRLRRRGVSVVMMTAERFTSEYVEAAQNSGLPSFRNKYRGLHALVLDDVQFFCGKKRTCEELLHTLETVRSRGGQVVLAADRPAAALQELGEALTARLQGGAQCPLAPPDGEVRLGVVAHAARRIDLALPREVCELVAAEFTAHARELVGAVNRLKLVSLAERRPVDLELARAAFRDCVRASTRLVQIHDVEQAVCEVMGIDARLVRSASKARSAAHPRMLIMWLARKHTRLGLTEIGRHFGNRRHSTVVSAHKKVSDWLQGGQSLSLADARVKVDEVIRRVESKLRVG